MQSSAFTDDAFKLNEAMRVLETMLSTDMVLYKERHDKYRHYYCKVQSVSLL